MNRKEPVQIENGPEVVQETCHRKLPYPNAKPSVHLGHPTHCLIAATAFQGETFPNPL